jgi:putative SOS response-associated peptidase YedK
LVALRWGLVPSWSRDAKGSARLLNARAETISDRPAFRAAFRRRRCLVPASGYYEWSRHGGGKRPHFIRMAGQRPFALAGLWEEWHDPGGEVVESCAVVTAGANDRLRPLHQRMPVILPPERYAAWIDRGLNDPAAVLALLAGPSPADALEASPIGPWVNDPRHEGARCLDGA